VVAGRAGAATSMPPSGTVATAWQLDPTEPTSAIRYARWCTERGQRAAAIVARAALPAGDDTLHRITLLAHYLVKRDAPGDREAAELLLSDGARQLPDVPLSLRAAWLEIYFGLLGGPGGMRMRAASSDDDETMLAANDEAGSARRCWARTGVRAPPAGITSCGELTRPSRSDPRATARRH